jgi:uncharacterized protein YndB with AHSA1/START domain
MSDVIRKQVELRAPLERVWQAISDPAEFGSWFKVRLDGPFEPGIEQTGQMTYPGYEHMPWKARVVAVEPPHRLAFDWPHMDDQERVREDWPWTRVEFRLEAQGEGTLLTVTESGFDALPPETRDNSYRQNEGGWEQQTGNIAAHVDG